MKSFFQIGVSTKYKILLGLTAIIGVSLILITTSHFGAGLSPDSAGYIAVARNMLNGEGVISYDQEPFVKQPPLYSLLLAFVSKIVQSDPLIIANYVNATIFGLIIYFGGLLFFRYLSFFPAFSFLGTLVILVSIPLFRVSIMVWTEPLFILFSVLSLLFVESYIIKQDIASLIYLALSIALLTFTRYIGVIIIVWGVFVIILYLQKNLKTKLSHIAIFIIITVIPISLWFSRNYLVSETFFGSRAASDFSLLQNIVYVIYELSIWYTPGKNISQILISSIFGISIVFLVISTVIKRWKSIKVILKKTTPILLFVIFYTIFLVISSTMTAYDRIGLRLLSPIYIPLTLLLLLLAHTISDHICGSISKKHRNTLLIICLMIWLIYPLYINIYKVKYLTPVILGYSSNDWKEGETVQYLLKHKSLVIECEIVSNLPDAIYILTELLAKRIPSKTAYNSSEIINNISDLKGNWPVEDGTCLVWFDNVNRSFLFTIEELQTIMNIDPIAQFEDGAIYIIGRK